MKTTFVLIIAITLLSAPSALAQKLTFTQAEFDSAKVILQGLDSTDAALANALYAQNVFTTHKIMTWVKANFATLPDTTPARKNVYLAKLARTQAIRDSNHAATMTALQMDVAANVSLLAAGIGVLEQKQVATSQRVRDVEHLISVEDALDDDEFSPEDYAVLAKIRASLATEKTPPVASTDENED